MTLTVLSLFAGIGGVDLGLERAGMRTVAQVEIDSFCQRALAKHWPKVSRHADIRTYRPAAGAADLVAGGFPCQPWSTAGKQRGRDDSRHLWPEFARVVADVRPRWILGENVPGIRGRGADEVLGDLEALGYACWPLVVAAADVGAPHERARVWFVGLNVADATSLRRKGAGARGLLAGVDGAEADPRRVPVAPEGDGHARHGRASVADAGRGCGGSHWLWPSRPGEPQWWWEAPRLATLDDLAAAGALATLDPAAHGLPGGLAGRRISRWRRAALKALGNAVVPQVVELVGRAILAADAALRGEAASEVVAVDGVKAGAG